MTQPLPLRLALASVALASLLVPSSQRRDFLQEWQAEILEWWSGAARPSSSARLLRRALLAFADAWTIRGLAASRLAIPVPSKEGPMSTWIEDLRFAQRSFRRRASLTLLLLATLALGIGGTTAIFSVLYGVVLAPLPYTDAARIVRVWPERSQGLSKQLLVELQQRMKTVDRLAIYSETDVKVIRDGEAELATALQVSGEYLATLGTKPAYGRLLEPADDRYGPRRAVLSWQYWERELGGDPGALGQVLDLDGEPTEIVGVLEHGFELPWGPYDLVTNHTVEQDDVDYNANYLDIVGRLAPGVTAEQATAELRTVALEYARLRGVTNSDDWISQATVTTLHESMVGDVRSNLWLLTGAVALILLIVVANLIHLLLARALSRTQELAMRTALGASRWRLTRQLVSEILLLALAGGFLGVALAAVLVRGLVTILPHDLPRLDAIGMHPAVLGVALALTIATGLAVGLVTAFGALRSNLRNRLGGSSRSTTSTGSRHRLRSSLVVAEVILAVILLVGATILARSMAETFRVDPGFDADGLVHFSLLPRREEKTPKQVEEDHRRLRDSLAALPGVESVAIVHAVPVSNPGWVMGTFPVDQPPAEGDIPPLAWYRPVSPEYFSTARISLLAGRNFDLSDTAESEPVVILNETLARAFYGGDTPLDSVLGKTFRITFGPKEGKRVIGVVEDVHIVGLRQDPPRAAYLPYPQAAPTLLAHNIDRRSYVLRSSLPTETLEPMIRSVVHAYDPLASVLNVEPMKRTLAASLAQSRAVVALLGSFALTALLLGAIGIYGVMSCAVGERTREMGIRLALGARSRAVLANVLASGLSLVALGLALGSVLALSLTRFLRGELFGVGATDPASFAVTAVTLLLAAGLAIWLPARRAGRVDPVDVLRSE